MKLYKRAILIGVLYAIYTAWVVLIAQIDRQSLLYPFVFAPLIEEAVFRYAVLEITLRSKNGWRYIWQVAIISSFIFGILHFNNGQNAVLVQGVFGFFMSYVYIMFRKYWYIIVLHAKWNIFCYYGLDTVMSWFNQ